MAHPGCTETRDRFCLTTKHKNAGLLHITLVDSGMHELTCMAVGVPPCCRCSVIVPVDLSALTMTPCMCSCVSKANLSACVAIRGGGKV